MIFAILTLFIISGINLYTPYVTKSIISFMEGGDIGSHMTAIIQLAMFLLALFAVRAVAQFINNYFAHVASWRLVNRIRCMVYDHLQELSMRYYHDKQTGQLMSRVVNDAATVENLMAHALPDTMTSIITLVGVLIILLTIDPLLAGFICIPIPFIAVMSVVLRRIRRYFQQGQIKIAELNALLQDNFSGMKEIQVFNRQSYELGRVGKKSKAHVDTQIRALFFSGILNPGVAFITSIGTIIVLTVGPHFAAIGTIDIADVVAFLLYLNLFYTPISTLTRTVEDMQQAFAGTERMFEILDTEPDICDVPGACGVSRLSGQLTFDDVCFSYDPNQPILHNISFDVRPGEMIALVGPTGVGKTTIAGLVARFYDPDSGRITMEGIDTRAMTLVSLREQLSIVLQDIFLFNGTIEENIAYGCDNPTPEAIRAAAHVACIDRFIESLPDGYNTFIGERGVKLSGGQKQRLSIARAILRDSPILILDEATSSVDTETEREIQEAINRIAGTRTLIVIAHRLSTIKRADKILVLHDGYVAETGTHEELLAKGGVYAELCSVQNLG